MTIKPKKTQPKTPDTKQTRDFFRTPKYAVSILMPYIPKTENIWECACGEGHISKILIEWGYDVTSTDIDNLYNSVDFNFLTDDRENIPNDTVIITNPPYSLKQDFYKKCRSYNVPFALLIPADYCGWIIQAIKDGCEKIIPTRRIDFITPSGLKGKESASNYHTMWLTYGFNIGKTETFVDLTVEDKKELY